VPTVKIDLQKDGHKVAIAVLATDATSYVWNYGDGKSSTADGSHEYTYEYSGDYTITVTVTGEGGTATASANVTIDPEPSEILAGTPATNPNGKKWVLDPKYYPGKNGAGPLISGLPITQDFLVDNVLEAFLGLGTEYDNEFTFKYDGSLVIDNKNGISLGGTYYSYAVAGTGPAPGFEGGMGLSGITYAPKANGKFELKQGDLNLDVVIEDPANLSAGWKVGKLELTNQWYIEPTDYFGFLEISKQVLIKEITSEHMHVVFLMHGVVEEGMKPSTAIHVTFIPKK
jgi:PKD repeat protein